MTQKSEPFEQALALVSNKGEHLDLATVRDVQLIMLACDAEECAWIDEAIGLIVNDPLYSGDVPAPYDA